MAIQPIIMPQLGESVTEGTIENWLVQPGDHVKKYDPLAEVMTDKVTAEIPSSFEGVIKEILVDIGEKVPVGTTVCTVEVDGENGVSVSEKTTDTKSEEEQKKPQQETTENHEQTNVHRYSPAVLSLARKHQIDLTTIKGTGLGGRITRKDIEKIIETGPQNIASHKTIPTKEESVEEVVSTVKKEDSNVEGDVVIPVSPVRKAIAKNMVKSKSEVPHAWMMIEVDVTDLVAYRNELHEQFYKQEGFKLTYFAFFLKAVAQALKEFPMMNAMWDGDTIIQKKDINLSIAVATEDALYVPVIKHADEKSVKGLAREIHELAGLVRNNKLKMEHLKGGTFTVNNTGSFGSVQSAGIINYPQAAILQVEAIVKRPVIIQDNMFAARDMVNLCLSLDHRVLDGLICGKFLARVKNLLENVKNDKMSVY